MATSLKQPTASSSNIKLQADVVNTTSTMETKSILYPSSNTVEEVQGDCDADEKRPSRWNRTDTNLYTQFPKTYGRLRHVFFWLRGPRPRKYLPGPKPFLSLNLFLGKDRSKRLLEPPFLRATRWLTASYILILLIVGYIISMSFLVRASSFLTPAEAYITCTSTYWAANDGCGLNGEDCIPPDLSVFEFRCPAQCKAVTLANPRFIGNGEVDHVPLVVGGGDGNGTYRADSFICAAAVHAGIVDDNRGGCASLQLLGNFTDFISSTANGLTSASFPTIFPLSFNMSKSTTLNHCVDLRNYALVMNVLATAALFLLLRPKAIILYWSLVCVGFWHITFFSQPRDAPAPIDQAVGTFLPTLFVAYALWRTAFRFTLPYFNEVPIERAVWYLASFWPGVLYNILTEKIPVDRLLASDINGRSGALASVIVIAIVVFLIVLYQLWIIKKSGWLYFYVGWYAAGGLTVLVLSQLPGLTFRLHHYIAAILLIPLTAFPTRVSAVCQGFLLGMFLNGVAAFDFDSILQTSADLRRDAAIGTLLPTFLTNSTTYNSSIPLQNQTIFWEAIAPGDSWDGFSLLIDDVLRYSGTALNFSLTSLEPGIPHFFRLAFQQDGSSGDFTKAATLWPNGTWVNPLPGPS